MEDLGMVVDVSHLNDAGFADVVRQARGPVVASHSNCRRLCDVPRNLTDEQLRALRDCSGVIGVNAYHGFVHKEQEKQTVERLPHHAAHIIDVCGIDHVGFGFDFCAYLGPGNDPIPDMTGHGQVPRMVEQLQCMGLREDELEKICRGNWLRVLETVLEK
jgi:membrane dipeptidase